MKMIYKVRVPTAYVSGNITFKHQRTDPKILTTMVEIVKSHGYDVYCPEIHTNQGELDNPKVTPREIFEKDTRAVKSSDLLVLENSYSGTGNGMEIMLAHLLRIPIILCVKSGSGISRMARGVPDIKIVEYINLMDLNKKLEQEIKSINLNYGR